MKVLLKVTAVEAIPALMEMERAADTYDYIYPFTVAEHRAVLDHPDRAHLSIFNEAGALVGFVLLYEMTNPNDRILLQRIVIAEKNKGYGRASLRAIKQYAFVELGKQRLWLDVFPDNARARHLYRSEGFVEEGILRNSIKSETGFKSLVLMSMLKDEYE